MPTMVCERSIEIDCSRGEICVLSGYGHNLGVLEIGRVLALRGYIIDFATLSGREAWLQSCPFISQSHVLGPSVTPEVEETEYLRMSDWTRNGQQDWHVIMSTKRFLESTWPAAYKALSLIMQDPARRPDFILADYLVDAAHDMMVEYGVPIAMHLSQMPVAMLPAPYIPGIPGLQVDILTSEHATITQRLRNMLIMVKALPHVRRHVAWHQRMRAAEGVSRPVFMGPKPDCLYLVNSFFGLEPAKDLPPNVVAVGPILSDSVAPLSAPYTEFLSTRSRVLYVALGTHVLLSSEVMSKLLVGALSALSSDTIDGIIWAIRPMARKQLDHTATVQVPNPAEPPKTQYGYSDGINVPPNPSTKGPRTTVPVTVARLLTGSHPSVLFVEHAPQRALLEDARVAVFLSHTGPASANEAAHAGVPVVALPVYFDQTQCAMRLRDAGVVIADSGLLDKDRFAAPDVAGALARVVVDDSAVAVNVERLRAIARVASRRKHLAADLVEEMLADAEGRRREGLLTAGGRPVRGFHLQTADGRMSKWRAQNWNLWAIGCAVIIGVLGLVLALPVALGILV